MSIFDYLLGESTQLKLLLQEMKLITVRLTSMETSMLGAFTALAQRLDAATNEIAKDLAILTE